WKIAAASAGRILFRADGSPLAIVELADIQIRSCCAELRRFLETVSEDRVTRSEVEDILQGQLGKPFSWARILPDGQADSDAAPTFDRLAMLQKLESCPRDFRFGANGLAISPGEALHAR